MPRNKEDEHDELTPELVAEHKKLNQFHSATESKSPYHEFLVSFPLQSAVILRTGTLSKQLRDAKEAAAVQQASNPKGPKRTGGIDRKPADGFRYAAIVEAVRCGSVDDLAALISAGVTIDSRSSSGRTALMYSIMEQRAECVKLLLDAKSDVKASDAAGMSVLHWAALYGDVELVKLLLIQGAEAWALNMGKSRPHEVMTSNDPKASSSLSFSALTKAVIKKQVGIVEAYLEAIYNRGRGLNRATLAVNFSSKGRSFSPGAGLKSNQNLSNLASFLALWDLFWEKIVVLQDADADGTVYKCEVILKLSRKTTVDLVAGRYDVIGYKRGNKPYKKFRDSGMIELKLSENIIQSELVDVSTDVAQPQPEKEAKKKKGKKGIAAVGHDGRGSEECDVEISCLLEDVLCIIVAGNSDYTNGIASLLLDNIMDSIDAALKPSFSKDIGGVFMEGPLVDLRSLPWESKAKTNISSASELTSSNDDANQGGCDAMSDCSCSVAEVSDGFILTMSTGRSLSFVIETSQRGTKTAGIEIRSQSPRFRLEGPLVDLRSLPWETEAATAAAPVPRSEVSASLETLGGGARVEIRDITFDSMSP